MQETGENNTLYIVGTPIGNLEDFTFRGVRVLSEVLLILAEDTRRAVKLLNHYKIKKKLESFFEFNQRTKIDKIIYILKTEGDVAIISDAGMPLISDPGFPLVYAAIKEGINVEVIPGASSVTASLVLSGFSVDRFYFGGFFPRKEKERKETIKLLRELKSPSIFFESSKRIKSTLNFIRQSSEELQIALLRELTKVYQEVIRGSAKEILEIVGKRELKGEITVVLSPFSPLKEVFDETVLEKSFYKLIESDKISKKEAIKILAEKYKVSKRELYQRFMKGKVNE